MKRGKSNRHCRVTETWWQVWTGGKGWKRYEKDSKHLVIGGLQHNHTCTALIVFALTFPDCIWIHFSAIYQPHSETLFCFRRKQNYHHHHSVEIPHNPRFQICFFMEEVCFSNPEELHHLHNWGRGQFLLCAPNILSTLDKHAQYYRDLLGPMYTKHRCHYW